MAPDSLTTGGDVTVNSRRYRLPRQLTVVVCIDGSEPGYIERAVEAGRAPGAGKACSFSSESSDKATLAENGIDKLNELVGMAVPDVYSAGLSEFVFAAGVKIMERDRPQIMYLSTTDYIQHKHAPGTPVANDFSAMMDGYMARLDAMGCTIALTAD